MTIKVEIMYVAVEKVSFFKLAYLSYPALYTHLK